MEEEERALATEAERVAAEAAAVAAVGGAEEGSAVNKVVVVEGVRVKAMVEGAVTASSRSRTTVAKAAVLRQTANVC